MNQWPHLHILGIASAKNRCCPKLDLRNDVASSKPLLALQPSQACADKYHDLGKSYRWIVVSLLLPMPSALRRVVIRLCHLTSALVDERSSLR